MKAASSNLARPIFLKVKITKFGHCCLLIEERGLRILTDPGSYSTAQNNVNNIHVILITHEHVDHIHIPSLKNCIKNNPKVKIFTNKGVAKILDKEAIKYELIEDGQKIEVGFDKYFSEMARVLKGGGTGIVTAPTSFGEVFTSGRIPKEEAIKSINEALEKIGGNDDSKVIKEYLGKLDDIYRATFAKRDGKWTLIEDESLLQSGEEIWRKLPGLIVPNYYHVEQEYVDAFEKAGLNIVSTSRECFKTEEERLTYNSKVKSDKHLGPEYVGNVPFAVFIVEKPLAKAS